MSCRGTSPADHDTFKAIISELAGASVDGKRVELRVTGPKRLGDKGPVDIVIIKEPLVVIETIVSP